MSFWWRAGEEQVLSLAVSVVVEVVLVVCCKQLFMPLLEHTL
jgi:hypothetical protein